MVIFIFYRIVCFLIGILLTTLGLSYLLIYFSLFGLGYSLIDYLRFVFTHSEIYLLIFGCFFLAFSLFFDPFWKRFIAYRKARRRASRDSK